MELACSCDSCVRPFEVFACAYCNAVEEEEDAPAEEETQEAEEQIDALLLCDGLLVILELWPCFL
jgi:hypothetical protein